MILKNTKKLQNRSGLQHEVWHGVISPNLGSREEDITALQDYFDKNHDFYEGTGNFKIEDQILNGNNQTGIPTDYEPYVFYYDSFREESAVSYDRFNGYKVYEDHKEDIVYSRFTKELAQEIKDTILGDQNQSVEDLFVKIDPDFDLSQLNNGPELANIPDIQTRRIIDAATKKFIDVFSSGKIGEFRKDVHNAGRYNDINAQVNVDLIPFLITVLDLVNNEVLKDINSDLENQIDEYVDSELARDIIIPVSHVRQSSYVASGSGFTIITPDCGFTSTAFYHGKQASSISSASECSIYKGSTLDGGKLVEANRGYNVHNSNGDANICIQAQTSGYWGGNSPLNLNISSASDGILELGSHDLDKAIVPLFDIAGSKEKGNQEDILSPLDCYDASMLLTSRYQAVTNGEGSASCGLTYKTPSPGSPVGWSCSSTNVSMPSVDINIQPVGGQCLISEVVLDGNVIRSAGGGGGEACTLGVAKETYNFKSIPSIITHKSPTPEELGIQVNAMVAPDLGVDKDRYVDFISEKTGEYARIDYPRLFRLDFDADTEVTFENTKVLLRSYLDDISEEVNEFATGTGTLDLLEYVEEKETEDLQIGTEVKNIEHFDTLSFAVYWNNLRSSAAKYKFIFENYLSDEFGDSAINTHLAKNKKQYEIAYLGAIGDAENMYVKLDPEDKAENPYGDIVSNNLNLLTDLMGANVGGGLDDQGLFECAPPEGVPIWEWIPAVVCRMKNMLPPTISISEGACGPSLLSDEEREEIFECNGDVNKNGINDCIETKLDGGTLNLSSDSSVYYYNTPGTLKAHLQDSQGNTVRMDNTTRVYFEVSKIEKLHSDNTKEIVYSLDDPYKQDQEIIDSYINFADLGVPVTRGVAEYSFVPHRRDADITFNAYTDVQDSDNVSQISLDAEDIKIEIRGDRLFAMSQVLENTEESLEINLAENTLKASDKDNVYLVDYRRNRVSDIAQVIDASSLAEQKLVFSLENISSHGEQVPLAYPLSLKTLLNGEQIGNEQTIQGGDLDVYYSLGAFIKSGTYELQVTDRKGFQVRKTFDILPEEASRGHIELGTSVMKTGGNISTNLITLFDDFQNSTAGELYNIDLQIEGDGIVFEENREKTLNLSTLEGYKTFRLLSMDNESINTLFAYVKDANGRTLFTLREEIKTLEDISLILRPLDGRLKVGGGNYRFEISLRDAEGIVLSDFKTRVYMTTNSIYGVPVSPYVEFVDGKAIVEFKTGTVAGKEIPVEFQVEGLGDIVEKTLTIYPEDPIRLDLSLSKNKMEAVVGERSILSVELKDRYDNLVFDNSSTSIDIEILEKYDHIISTNVESNIVDEGIAQFTIEGTINPGTGYFKVSADPGLESNTFTIGETTITGVSENAGKIETFYFWNHEKLEGKKYNALYTTLLGAPYGDISQENYLAGSLLFNRSNRSLAVTSLLNNPYSYNDVIQVGGDGNISFTSDSSNLTQDILTRIYTEDGKLGMSFWNEALSTYMGKLVYNFGDNLELETCEQLSSCTKDNESTYISLIQSHPDFSAYEDDGRLLLQDRFGKNILEVDQNGRLRKTATLDFQINDSVTEGILLDIFSSENIIGQLRIHTIGTSVNISRDEEIFNTKVDNISNSILLYVHTHNYGVRDIYLGDGSVKKSIYYNDPFDSEYALNNFSRGVSTGYENFVTRDALGWEGGNKTLLAFSAGKSVGEAVQDYPSFSVVNLGDPVISLKKIEKNIPGTTTDRKFDSTIGRLLSTDKDISEYQIFDYNNDRAEDILLIKQGSYLKLLENVQTESQYVDMGNLAYIVDLGNTELVKTGDFTGDGYDDVFFVNDAGEPFLLNNYQKDFARISLASSFALEGRIIRAEVFDMDNDGETDIVTLDDSGRIHIFYGGGTAELPAFTKLLLSESYGITLNDGVRSDHARVYFDGLYQIPQNGDNGELLENRERYLQQLEENATNIDSGFNEEVFESIIFEQLTYERLGETSSEEIVSVDDFIYNTDDYTQYAGSALTDTHSQTTFIKGEYSELEGLKVEKVYNDINGGFLKSDDRVEVNITLTNIGDETLHDIAYIESLPELFQIDQSSIQVSDATSLDTSIPLYEFLVDNFSLLPDESIEITYVMKTLPIKYGYLKVGLYENSELGDDEYGDIIVKDSHENCSQEAEIFRSIGARDYGRGVTAPVCDDDKIQLPESIAQNAIDEDNNGIPDYIDELTNGSVEKIQEFSEEQLDRLHQDSDGDGIPDEEDFINAYENFTSNLNSVNENVNGILDDVDHIMQGLSCGFGGGAGCVGHPLNWAPLAPGSDPTIFGFPVGDGLHPFEGIPTFASITTCSGIPGTWPPCPIGAGGYFGYAPGPFRLFITPTLTGAVGLAACFGDNLGMAFIPPPGISPFVLGGNCIVVATSSLLCSGDGSEGDVASTGFPDINGPFELYNGNCSEKKEDHWGVSQQDARNFLNYKKQNNPSNELKTELKDALSRVAKGENSSGLGLSEPLISMDGGEGGGSFNVEVDTEAFMNGDFSDVLKISMKRIPSFPGFLMDWVERQLEEIITKLTDFPTLFIILPDFTGLFDGNWGERTGNSGKYDEDFETFNEALDTANSWTDENLDGNEGVKSAIGGARKVGSGIKEAYEFLANVPLVQIEQDIVNVNVPWTDAESIERTIQGRGNTLNQWKGELKRASEVWTLGAACSYDDPTQQRECEERSEAQVDLSLKSEALISSLEKNLEVLESYKKIPEDINKMVNVKQRYLEQIICNIEAISTLLGGWIGENGKRFKAWVELYVLIKAILKSWQLLLDIFLEYDAGCHQCKNERFDLMNFLWSLISMIIPKIPVVIFPKWPDIILDLHNIRASINIVLPEYSFETRPIIFPVLPELKLPDVPSLNIALNLPALDILPELHISALPDLPSLPTVELPNLPPPPKVPKLFGALEAIIDILKLVTKIMCLLRGSVFVPEWRAGDLIAFITERQGFMGFDFINISLPQFSIPFVDAISVTTYVNFEVEADFLVEMSRQVAMPINSFPNDFSQFIQLEFPEIEVPESIDIELNPGDETAMSQKKQQIAILAIGLVRGFGNIVNYIESEKNNTVDSVTFKQFINENLASNTIASDPKFDELRRLWSDVNSMTYSREEKLIQELQDNNREKFQVLTDILNTEIEKNKKLKENISDILNPSFISSVSVTTQDDIEVYNNMMHEYNRKFVDSAMALIHSDGSKERKELQQDGAELLGNIKTPLQKYSEAHLFALENNSPATVAPAMPAGTTCQAQVNSDYKYQYKGLYIVEQGTSYRLFDYIDRLSGDEKTTLLDVDNDSDQDLIYMVDGEIFLKENLNINLNPITVDLNPIVLHDNENRFYREQEEAPFYESVNNFREIGASNNAINMRFSSSTQSDINNYRAEFFRIIDRFSDTDISIDEPSFITKSIVDAFAGIDETTFVKETELGVYRRNLGYINDIGSTIGVKMKAQNMINISDDIRSGSVVNLSRYTTLYAGNSSFTLRYTFPGSNENHALVVGRYQNVELKDTITVSGITGDAYIKDIGFTTLEGEEIRSQLYMPLFPEESIEYIGSLNRLDERSHIDVRYYDNSEALLDFREVSDYLIYDLGIARDDYVLRLERENDFYYAKIRSFSENNFSTHSNKTLLSPQRQADTTAPDLFVDFSIRVPVYQTKLFDLTPYIYEDGGIRGIQDIQIDMNPSLDADGDGNPKNDRGAYGVNISKTASQIRVDFGPFTELTKRKIGVTLTDINNNVSYTEIPFEVYAPNPKIEDYNNHIIEGSINEELENEPITLYRYRGGTIEKLEDREGQDTVWTTNIGDYNFSIDEGDSGLTLKLGNDTLIYIDEQTGQIIQGRLSSEVKVERSSEAMYPRLIVEYDNQDVYYQYLKVDPVARVDRVEGFYNLEEKGLYVKFMNTSSYGYYQIPEAAPYNPGAFAIYRVTDTEKTPLFTILRDGKIATLNEFYTLEYENYENYIVLKMIDKHFNREVAKILFYVEGEYVME